jgi:putative transposase
LLRHPEQIIAILKQHEASVPTAAACRKLLQVPKSGGMDVSDVKRLKTLEDEHAKLKRTTSK